MNEKNLTIAAVIGGIIIVGLLTFILIGPKGTDSGANQGQRTQKDFKFTFAAEKDQWTAEVSDYTTDIAKSKFELKTSVEDNKLVVSSKNDSSDLFTFLYRKLDGLTPNTKYEIVANVKFVSTYPKGSVGAGGSPAESVYMKFGVIGRQPSIKTIEEAIVTNFDHGDQSGSGEDALMLDSIGTKKTDSTPETLNLTNTDFPFVFTTDDKGEAWVIVGTDSGFTGTTKLAYQELTLKATPK